MVKSLINMFVVLGFVTVSMVANASCPADIDGNGIVSAGDLGAILGSWGTCEGDCVADIDGNGIVSAGDLGMLLGSWGVCPVEPSCDDLAGTDWGACAPSPLGAGVVDGACTMIFGCEIPDGVALYANVTECEANCNPCYTNDDCAANEYCNLSYGDDVCAASGQCEARAEICTSIYDPICSCDNTIVSNACVATIQGASVQYEGECPQEDVCNSNGGTWDPAAEECICPEGEEYNYQRGCQVP